MLSGLLCAEAQYTEKDPHMGDWAGTLHRAGAAEEPLVARMIPLGGGRYQARLYPTVEKRAPLIAEIQGRFGDAEASFIDDIPLEKGRILKVLDDGLAFPISVWSGRLDGNGFSGTIDGKIKGTFALKKQTYMPSPMLGRQPIEGATVLFDGKSLAAWTKRGGSGEPAWKLVEGGAAEVSGGDIQTKENFGDCELHVEFRSPYMPHAKGQARGNSGVYLQGAFEVQVLDSYGLEGEDNECGGIYTLAKPLVNACAPPMQWQSYEITFRKARFDATGKKTEPARITVIHNGIKIHDNVELTKSTGGALSKDEAADGPILLQDHGNPVQYRNIWIKRLRE